jgi:hypothetical protein
MPRRLRLKISRKNLLRTLAICAMSSLALSVCGDPTAQCNPTPWTTEVGISRPSSSLTAAIGEAVAHSSTDPFFDRLGNPLGTALLTIGSTTILVLRYDPVQDTAQIAADLAHDAALAGQFSSVSVGSQGCFSVSPPPIRVDLTEYYNTVLGHYFISSSAIENASIDSGGAGPGWIRTGQYWKTYQADYCTFPSKAVYRFYGTPGIGPNSHFYTADPTECGGLRNGLGWSYEGVAFGAYLPVQGQCPAQASIALYRAYNNRWMYNDSNHRYASDPAIYQQMIAAGWIGEGVALCLPNVP